MAIEICAPVVHENDGSHPWPSKSRLQEIQVASRFISKKKMDWTEELWEKFASRQFQGRIEKREAGQV
jgi:hypothetical protein